jgi:hypothetical protein
LIRERQICKERTDDHNIEGGTAEGQRTVKSWVAIRSFAQVAAAWNDANPSHRISRQRAEEIHDNAIRKMRKMLAGFDREWWGDRS